MRSPSRPPPGDRVVAGGRGELAAGDQRLAPPGEHLLHLVGGRRDTQLRIDRGARPVDLVQRALDDPTCHVVQVDLVPKLQELEVHGQCCGPPGAGRRFGVAQHLAEVDVGIGGLNLPQRPAEPVADQLEVVGVVAIATNPADARANTNPASTSVSSRQAPRSPGLDVPADRGPQPEPTHASSTSLRVKKHHPINNSVGKNDASSSEGFGGGTRLQRLVPALKGLTGDTCGLRNPSTVGYCLPRRGHPVTPGVPLPTASHAAHRRIPRPHRRRMAGIPRPLRAPQGLHRNLGRAVGTPCVHEHSCLRCSMHWPDPAQRQRIAEIRDNLIARIAEAEREGWLGEVEGLQISLAGANDKLGQIDRRSTPRCRPRPARHTTPENLMDATPFLVQRSRRLALLALHPNRPQRRDPAPPPPQPGQRHTPPSRQRASKTPAPTPGHRPAPQPRTRRREPAAAPPAWPRPRPTPRHSTPEHVTIR